MSDAQEKRVGSPTSSWPPDHSSCASRAPGVVSAVIEEEGTLVEGEMSRAEPCRYGSRELCTARGVRLSVRLRASLPRPLALSEHPRDGLSGGQHREGGPEVLSDRTQGRNIVLGDPTDDGIPYLARCFPTEMVSVQGTCHEQRYSLPPVELPLRDSQCIGDVPESVPKRSHAEETCSDSLKPHGVKRGW